VHPLRWRVEFHELVVGLRLPPQPHRLAHEPALLGHTVALDQLIDAVAAGFRPSGVVWHFTVRLVAITAKRCSELHSVKTAGSLDSRQTMTTTGRWRSALADAAALLGVVWMVPVGILLVGAPVVLVVALLLWLGRLARAAI
jgi:hypothetical protein